MQPRMFYSDPEYVDRVAAARIKNTPVASRPSSAKTRGRGGFLSSLISELGGAGGAAGGAAIGTALLPGIGTVLGAGLGGLLGGTGGRVAENKIRDNRIGLGDALKEGALSGAFSGLGAGFQVAKVAKGAKALAGTLGDDVTKAAIPIPTRVGMIENKGLGLTSKAGGYFTGASVPGSTPLSPSKVKEYDSLLRKLKIPANDASDLARSLDDRLKQTGAVIEKTIEKNNVSIAPKEAKNFANSIVKRVADTPGLGQEGTNYAQQQAAKLAKVKDAKSLLQFRRDLDKFINFNLNPDSALAEKQGVARVFRELIKDRTDSLLPGIRQQNKVFHDLSNINDYVLRAANRGNVQGTQAGAGITGRILTSPTANTARAKVGSALQDIGRATAGTGGPATQVTQNLVRQSPASITRGLTGGVENMQQNNLSPEQMEEPGPLSIEEQLAALGGQLGGAQEGPQAPQTYSLQQALAEAQQLLGPDESPASYLSYAKALQANAKPDKKAAKAQDAVAAGSQALGIVDELEQAYARAGGGQGRIAGTISSFAGKAGQNDSVNVYNDSKMGFLSNVARSLGEKGVITDYDIDRIAKLFPSPSSNPAEAAAKWSMIKSIIAGGVQKFENAYSPAGAPADLSSLIQQGAY